MGRINKRMRKKIVFGTIFEVFEIYSWRVASFEEPVKKLSDYKGLLICFGKALCLFNTNRKVEV